MNQGIIGAATLATYSIAGIADVVSKDWKPGVSPYAQPYLTAMRSLNTIEDEYIADSGRSIVAYFLSNARSYKGEQARLIKRELNRRLDAEGK